MFLLFLHGNLCYGYGECPTILYNKVSDKWHMQTMQTQIRLLLKKQSDKSLLCHSTKYSEKQLLKKGTLTLVMLNKLRFHSHF